MGASTRTGCQYSSLTRFRVLALHQSHCENATKVNMSAKGVRVTQKTYHRRRTALIMLNTIFTTAALASSLAFCLALSTLHELSECGGKHNCSLIDLPWDHIPSSLCLHHG